MKIETLTSPTDICLVSTYSPNHASVVSESLGSEALAGDIIGEFGKEVAVDHLDLQIDRADFVKDRMRKIGNGVVGISLKIGATSQLQDLVNSIENSPNSPLLVLGGVVPTFASDELLEQYPKALIAIGEAELSMRGIVEHIKYGRSLETVPGLAFIKNGEKIQTNPERLDLTKLRLPARITTERIYKDHDGLVWFEGSRGCDWHCTFCSRRSLRGDGFSGSIPVDHVVDDIEGLYKLGIKFVHASDDDWGGDPERNLLVAEKIIERGIDLNWSISTRADHIWVEAKRGDNLELVEKLNNRLAYIMRKQIEAGLDRVFLGLESFSPSQLKRYGKCISAEANYKSIEILKNLGVNVVAGYIPIDPLMTIEELRENLVGLRLTGMYKSVSSPLSILRIQEGSNYLEMARKREKIDGIKYVGDKTDDLVFYEIENYADKRVQKIADIASKWVIEMHPIIFDLKMELFSSTQDSIQEDIQQKWSEYALGRFRDLEMQFIESATDILIIDPDDNLDGLISEFNKKRYVLLAEISAEMSKMGIFFSSNSYLKEIIKNVEVA